MEWRLAAVGIQLHAIFKKQTTSLFARASLFIFNKKNGKKCFAHSFAALFAQVLFINNFFAINHNGQLPISPVGVKHHNNMSSRWFDTPSRSIFIIFQEEYKGPKNEILISGAPKSIQPGFQAYSVNSPPPQRVIYPQEKLLLKHICKFNYKQKRA